MRGLGSMNIKRSSLDSTSIASEQILGAAQRALAPAHQIGSLGASTRTVREPVPARSSIYQSCLKRGFSALVKDFK